MALVRAPITKPPVIISLAYSQGEIISKHDGKLQKLDYEIAG